jgi:exodeoxyribonuclease-3
MRQRNIGWRLDYVLASQRLFERVRSCVILKDVGTSDHAPVVVDFDVPPQENGRRSTGEPENGEGKLF